MGKDHYVLSFILVEFWGKTEKENQTDVKRTWHRFAKFED
jgi:hypothetical protein